MDLVLEPVEDLARVARVDEPHAERALCVAQVRVHPDVAAQLVLHQAGDVIERRLLLVAVAGVVGTLALAPKWMRMR